MKKVMSPEGSDVVREQFSDEPVRLPLMALRGLVLFPGMTMHFDVGRKRSIAALESALRKDTPVFLVTQKDIRDDDPGRSDLYEFGTIGIVRQVLKLSPDCMRVLVEGVSRAKILEMSTGRGFSYVTVQPIAELVVEDMAQAQGAVREMQTIFEEYAMNLPRLSGEIIVSVMAYEQPGELADYVASNINMKYPSKQQVLECIPPIERLKKLILLLHEEIEIMGVEQEIRSQVKDQMDQNHREYYLREQLRAIQSELGEGESTQSEASDYRRKIHSLQLAEGVREHLLKEVSRLNHTPPSSSETAVIRTYLDTCLSLPWNKLTKDRLDLGRVRAKLDKDHYGMVKVKERIVEHLAVQKLTKGKKNSQVICLIGPPGVGKTSVAVSIAGALGRKYARIALGGIRDEAEIRGHRKTYIGAMPGRIISAMIQSGSSNPLILLDEIDKLTSDVRGDPAAALLEVLDTEQNSTFRDHYIEVPFDLSEVLFITTANNRDTIPRPLLDRMELIELSSYTDAEKLHIARDHLVPKQIARHGLRRKDLRVSNGALYSIMDGYTREAGVRALERQIATLCRKTAVGMVSGTLDRLSVTEADLAQLLGPIRYKRDHAELKDEIGLCNGLAWTGVGGELLGVEVAVTAGTGKVKLTGSLGDVMKESCDAAITYIRNRAEHLNIDPSFYQSMDIHIHFPEGAVPKDGPSAGIAVTTALASALSGRPVRGDVAMTGEVTLRGRVLPIGGLREKAMTAYRERMQVVILPADNKADIEEIDEEVRNGLVFELVSHVDNVLDIALLPEVEGGEEPVHISQFSGKESSTGTQIVVTQ